MSTFRVLIEKNIDVMAGEIIKCFYLYPFVLSFKTNFLFSISKSIRNMKLNQKIITFTNQFIRFFHQMTKSKRFIRIWNSTPKNIYGKMHTKILSCRNNCIHFCLEQNTQFISFYWEFQWNFHLVCSNKISSFFLFSNKILNGRSSKRYI